VKITLITCAILGLLAGVGWGSYMALQLSPEMEAAAAMSASSVTSGFSTQQFRHADGDHARNAVLLEISLLESLERATRDLSYRAKLGYAFTRLAMIEESANHPEAARSALEQAKSWFKSGSGKEPTDDQMKGALTKMDSALDRL
jgi:hypothetical protein